MKRKALITIAFLALSLFAFQFGIASQQSTKADFSQLELALATPKAETLLLEPIPLSLKLSNRTKYAITAHRDFGVTSNYVQVFVGTNVKTMKEITDKSLIQVSKFVQPFDLEAGQAFESEGFLMLKLDEYFPQSGTYKLQVAFRDIGGARIFSNVVTLNVVEPQGIDRVAYDYIKQSGKADVFFSGIGIFRKDGTDVTQEFAAAFESSGYADHALAILAERKFAEQEYTEAEALFDKVKKKGNPLLIQQAEHYIEEAKKRKSKT